MAMLLILWFDKRAGKRARNCGRRSSEDDSIVEFRSRKSRRTCGAEPVHTLSTRIICLSWAIGGQLPAMAYNGPWTWPHSFFEDLDASRVGYMAKLGTSVALLNPCGAQPPSCMLTNRTATAIMWHGTRGSATAGPCCNLTLQHWKHHVPSPPCGKHPGNPSL